MIKLKKDGIVRFVSEQSLTKFKRQGYEVVDSGREETTETHTEGHEAEEEQEKEVTHVGAGWYELPNGDRVRGKDNIPKELGD